MTMQIILNYLWLLPFMICIALAGISNSFCDTLKDHFSTSIFSTWKNQDFVDPTKSWDNKYSTWIPDTFTDLWHMCKFAMLTFFMLSAISLAIFHPKEVNWSVLLIIPAFGLAWNEPFNLFYNKILKR